MDTCFIQTKASSLSKKPSTNFTAAIFESDKPKKIALPSTEQPHGATKTTEKVPSINIKRVKHEITQLAISGFDASKKKEAKIQQVLKLGAKPPKAKYKNYKLLQKEKQLEKIKLAKASKLQQVGKNQIGKSTAKGKGFNKQKGKKQGILDIYGKIKSDDKKKQVRTKFKK